MFEVQGLSKALRSVKAFNEKTYTSELIKKEGKKFWN